MKDEALAHKVQVLARRIAAQSFCAWQLLGDCKYKYVNVPEEQGVLDAHLDVDKLKRRLKGLARHQPVIVALAGHAAIALHEGRARDVIVQEIYEGAGITDHDKCLLDSPPSREHIEHGVDHVNLLLGSIEACIGMHCVRLLSRLPQARANAVAMHLPMHIQAMWKSR